jgi:hypothetical protein
MCVRLCCTALSTCVAAAAVDYHAPNQALKQSAPVHQYALDSAAMHKASVLLLLLLLLLTMPQTKQRSIPQYMHPTLH